ncbi:MAG: hypothetical protein R6U85_06215 [Salinivirgaceae bacterium]
MNPEWITNPVSFISNCDIKPAKAYIVFFFILISSVNVIGQESKLSIDGYSVNPKLGMYKLIDDNGGAIGGAEFIIIRNKFIFSIDFYRYEEFTIFGPNPTEVYNQIGTMIGGYNGEKLFRLQYQLGVASLWGIKRTALINEGTGLFSSDKYDSKHFFTAGLTTKLGFKIIPLKFLALGIDFQMNINPEKMVYMPMISIEIGKLRDEIK